MAEENQPTPKEDVVKSVDKAERRALFVVLAPDEVDLHGDIYSAVEVEKACIQFNRHCMKANLFHAVETEAAQIEQSFINLADFDTDDGRTITKGTWCTWMHFPEGDALADDLWAGVLDGSFNGVSIGARATVEDLTDE
ncbi:hypothetical protein [Pseudomonas phage PH826]|uniref:Phage-like element PBSX protein XkdF domain-containing protein n=3 Tax=Nankokuvirus TaxID=1925779 RepID=A0A218L3W3_9CAUD|nr:XkdF-like putative serine protease domain-containing protein [Pseudomonas aeruginosa]YP_004306752.1 DNA methyltransferase [Pseudomonas phage KPP10]YP_009206017.1 DNA methyltransferase [Pseudomonas phage vB_PaeM_PS24]YP_009604680.1 DNA methyltransferase [Pseudomonas phage vB_PaeM_G1]UVD32723.1 hypothetical protein [Pseudomonas phage PH826]AIW01757.1 hypothetical protein vB_PaeM_PS2400055 [Pseudomonas phage vB_PaeM_PS24]ARW57320.1 hypothetical protein vBPaeMG1_053 [Pseudomonas phage vB_PaeM_